MNVIQPYISDTLKTTLNDIYQSLAPHFETSNTNLINHKLFYCNKWDASRNKHTYLLDMLRNECDKLRILMEENTLLQINYIHLLHINKIMNYNGYIKNLKKLYLN